MSPTGMPTRSSGPTARAGSPPGWSRPRSTGSCTPARWWCCTRPGTGSPVPSLARWLLGLGIAATLTANMAQGWSHGPAGGVVAAWPAVSLVGSYEFPGLAHPHVRDSRTQADGRAPWRRRGLPRRGASCHDRSHRPRVPPPRRARHTGPGTAACGSGRRAGGSPPAGSVTRRYLRLAPSMTPRWPRTGGAPKPAIRSPNASWPRCSDAHPAAGRAPESPKHGACRLPGSWWIRRSPSAPNSRRAPSTGPPGTLYPAADAPGVLLPGICRSAGLCWPESLQALPFGQRSYAVRAVLPCTWSLCGGSPVWRAGLTGSPGARPTIIDS